MLKTKLVHYLLIHPFQAGLVNHQDLGFLGDPSLLFLQGYLDAQLWSSLGHLVDLQGPCHPSVQTDHHDLCLLGFLVLQEWKDQPHPSDLVPLWLQDILVALVTHQGLGILKKRREFIQHKFPRMYRKLM